MGSKVYNRFTALAASGVVSVAAGTPYLYGVFSPQLITHLGLSAADSATFALASNIGSGIGGLPGGMLIDTHGPRLALVVGSLCIFSGYMTLHYCYTHRLPHVGVICGALAVVGFGCVTGFYACVKTCATNFPDFRGTAGAVPVSAYGLSALVFSLIFSMYYATDSGGFLRFLAVVCGVTMVVGGVFVRLDPPPALPLQGSPLQPLLGSSLQTLQGSSLQGPSPRTQRTPSSVSHTPNGPSRRPPGLTRLSFPHNERSALHRSESAADIARTVKDAQALATTANAASTLKRLFTSRAFLAHYILLALVAATGQMYIYSVGFVVQAQVNNPHRHTATTPEAAQALQVSLLSACSFGGRLFSGPVSDFLMRRVGAQRHWLVMTAGSLLLTGQYLGTRLDSIDSLWLVSVLVGLAYGLVMGVFPIIMADLFGTAGLSTTWGLICTGPLALLFFLSSYFGAVYDRHSENDSSGRRVCLQGVECYREAFVTTEAVCVVLFGLCGAIIYYRARRI